MCSVNMVLSCRLTLSDSCGVKRTTCCFHCNGRNSLTAWPDISHQCVFWKQEMNSKYLLYKNQWCVPADTSGDWNMLNDSWTGRFRLLKLIELFCRCLITSVSLSLHHLCRVIKESCGGCWGEWSRIRTLWLQLAPNWELTVYRFFIHKLKTCFQEPFWALAALVALLWNNIQYYWFLFFLFFPFSPLFCLWVKEKPHYTWPNGVLCRSHWEYIGSRCGTLTSLH